jgi:hypothetical protein
LGLFQRAKQAAEKLGISSEKDRKSPSAAKAGVASVGFMRGLKRLRKKARIWQKFPKYIQQGLKPALFFILFGTTEVVP